jgi:exonuclease SbcD
VKVRLLCAADLHLGRQPSRLPASLLDGSSARSLSPSAAWRGLVAAALELEVHAVVLAGDVVEQSDDFYEAYPDLRSGVEELTAAGIQVVAVAGNHDLEVLPRLAAAVDGFTLLGAGGRWEALEVTGEGGSLGLVGWSFPRESAAVDPLSLPMPAREDRTTIGVLHCDRDASGGRYAPVRSADLKAADVDAWLLGHIHKPDPMTGERPIGYLGSLTGTDPGEAGPRGAWLLEASGSGRLSMERLALAPLRWEELEVPVDGLVHGPDVHLLITRAVEELHRRIEQGAYRPRAVGVRLILTGRTGQGEEIRRALVSADPRGEPMPHGDTSYFVHDWRLEALPALDLEELARTGDPAGLLAAKLLLLRQGPGSRERSELVRAARSRLGRVSERRNFRPLTASVPAAGDEEIAKLLETAALQALEAMLAQRESAP